MQDVFTALYATRNFNLYYREYVTKEDTLEALRKERKLPEFSDREYQRIGRTATWT